jgi:murein hydrolase activator
MQDGQFRRAVAIGLWLVLWSFGLSAQTKEQLQKDRDRINKQIELTKKLLEESKKDLQTTTNQLQIINRQISLRQELLENINREIENNAREISNKNSEIALLTQKIEDLKVEYGKMIFMAYKNRNAYDRLMYVFSADDFNQAYKRMKIMQQYAEVRKKQAEHIGTAQTKLNAKVSELEAINIAKAKLANEKEKEKEQLASDRMDREIAADKLKQREGELRKQQQDQEKERQRLNAAIQKIIEDEIKAERAKSKTGAYELTPEGKIVSENFEKNKGSLPWPISRGIITSKFGQQAHPTLPGITIDNKGVDINTEANEGVKSVFGGKVTSLFSIQGAGYVIIVTHGAYKSVYSNLKEVSVKQGDDVSAGQRIATVMTDAGKSVVHFEVWKISGTQGTPQNPEHWLKR